MQKINWLRIGIWLVAILGIGGLLAFLLQPGPVFYFSLAWVVVIAALLWVGNRGLTRILDRWLPWSRYGNVRFFVQLLVALAYLLVLINGTYYAIKTPLTGRAPTSEQLIVATGWGCLMFIPTFSIYFSLHFLRHWRKSELEVERYQKETMKSELDALKNHLDPHFLFNNLSILVSLIDTNRDASKTFVQRLADVYRSVLKSKSDDLVPLSEELKQIEAYVYLLKMRFADRILVEINVPSKTYDSVIPPLSLQMLIENAIKHNVITESKPLHVSVTATDDGYLRVSNVLNRKEQRSNEGTGLENIRRRYAHFTNREVIVTESDNQFLVSIPLLEIEHA